MSNDYQDEIDIIKGKIAILNKHLKKLPIQKSHEEFLMKRLCICVTELSELEQATFTDKMNYGTKKK